MTINGITSTYASFSAMRLTINVTVGQPASQTANSGTASPTDSVTLSPAATTSGSPSASTGTTAAPAGTAAPPSQPAPPSSSDRAAALFAALDADEDGAITEDEFSAGAKRLLAQGRPPRRAGHDRAEHDRGDHRVHDGHGSRRLERKLDRLFDRVDANGDGSLDQTELTDALAAADRRREPPPPPQGQEPGSDPAAGQAGGTGTVVTFSMTFVSIAVKRYTTLQSGESTAAATAPSTGAVASGTTATPPQDVDTPLAA